MNRVLWIGALAITFSPWAETATVQAQPDASLRIIQLDALERVFCDQTPIPMRRGDPVAVPRGGKAAFLFVLSSTEAGSARLNMQALRTEEGRALDGTATIYEALPVTVEANTRQAGTPY